MPMVGSFVVHLGLLAASALIAPPLASTADEHDSGLDERRHVLQFHFEGGFAEEQPPEASFPSLRDDRAQRSGGTGVRASRPALVVSVRRTARP